MISLLAILLSVLSFGEKWVSVSYSDNKYTVKDSKDTSMMAYVRFQNIASSTGWGKIEGFMSSNVDSDIAARCLGYAEGYLTQTLIDDFFQNIQDYISSLSPANNIDSEVKTWMKTNHDYVDAISQHADNDFRKDAAMIYNQFKGMYDGYAAASGSNPIFDEDTFYLLESLNDLTDVMNKYDNKNDDTTLKRYDQIIEQCHSSGFLKLTPLKTEFYLAHSTKFTYGAMLRLKKTYHYQTPQQKKVDVFMTSYPGLVSSTDNFLTTSNDLAIADSTLAVLNHTLYDSITTDGFPSWVRVMASAVGAADAPSFVSSVHTDTTHTHTAQIVCVDYKKIHDDAALKKGLPKDTAVLVELYPGGAEQLDLAEEINKHHFFSMHNTPHSSALYASLGLKAAVAAQADAKFFFSNTENTRCKQYADLNHQIFDLATAEAAIRHNNYKGDSSTQSPLGHARDAGAAVAARYELREHTGDAAMPARALGAIDGKVCAV